MDLGQTSVGGKNTTKPFEDFKMIEIQKEEKNLHCLVTDELQLNYYCVKMSSCSGNR